MTRLARDPYPSAAYSTEFMVQDTTLGMVGGDAAGNVVVYNFMPRKGAASDELVARADFHVGSMVRKMVRRQRCDALLRLRSTVYANARARARAAQCRLRMLPVGSKQVNRLAPLMGVCCTRGER